jgi:hypothetical protein
LVTIGEYTLENLIFFTIYGQSRYSVVIHSVENNFSIRLLFNAAGFVVVKN